MRLSFALSSICILVASGCGDSGNSKGPEIGDALDWISGSGAGSVPAGKAVFNRIFSPADGLGPLFNAEGCGVCHRQPVAGGGSQRAEIHATSLGPPQT